jgi:CRISPR-associated protein Csm4
MTIYLCKLKNLSSFHIGKREKGEQETYHIVPSDTLFSAFCNIYKLMYGGNDLTQLLELFKSNPPFKISSVFPIGGNQLLFPVPKNIDLHDYARDVDVTLKQVELISEGFFHSILKGESIEITKKDIAQNGKIIIKDFTGDVFIEREIPRVVIDRRTHESNIRYFSEVIFQEGLFFLIDVKKEEYMQKITAVFHLLGKQGLGGDRSNGRGLFRMKKWEMYSFPKTSTNWFLTLSLVIPGKNETKELDGFFGLVDRGGWSYSPGSASIRKKTVTMFTEGSLFNKNIVGDLVTVGMTNHPIYRYGYSFSVSMEAVV